MFISRIRFAFNFFASILVVYGAISSHVAYAGIYLSPAQKTADWLENQQDKSDGSWRDADSEKTWLQTTEAVLALHQLNRRRAAYYSGQSWVENHEPGNLDARSRKLFVLRSTQSNAKPDIDLLLAAMATPAVNPNGWGLAANYLACPLDTALVLDALRSSGVDFSSGNAIAYLKATQLTGANDKGWSVGSGTVTDIYVTARIIQTLSSYRSADPSLIVLLNNAIDTLKLKVTTSSPAHLRAVTALAYLRMDINSIDARMLLNSLTTLQRADGGFEAGVLTASLVAQAYAAAEGLDFLIQRLRVDMPDAVLRGAVNAALGRGALDQLNQGELAQLTVLDIRGLGVTSLQGLQYATGLTNFYAENNDISDFSPISGLTNLAAKGFAVNSCSSCLSSGSVMGWKEILLDDD